MLYDGTPGKLQIDFRTIQEGNNLNVQDITCNFSLTGNLNNIKILRQFNILGVDMVDQDFYANVRGRAGVISKFVASTSYFAISSSDLDGISTEEIRDYLPDIISISSIEQNLSTYWNGTLWLGPIFDLIGDMEYAIQFEYDTVTSYFSSSNALISPAPDVIKDILETELGVTGIDIPSNTGYDTWEYAFTVDKKIGSKQLIEGIASVSPYIPRFNNMGEFKFDVIPMDGGTADRTIKEADCIDFSFSRSKIESVFTKIEFFYNWDYARGEFNDSVIADIEDILENYDYDYYGLKGDHSESTLIIDDMGKYIRDHTTARDFAEWYLLWSCNQKLKLKIKLPLKYMDLEIGDFVDYDAILGRIEPYGIDYVSDGQLVNAQLVFNTFLITSTSKNLEFCEIECIQMHDLGVTFEADIIHEVIASSALDGFIVQDIHTDFPELVNLVAIQGTSGSATYYQGYGWFGSLINSPIVGGDIYKIQFSQETATSLFVL